LSHAKRKVTHKLDSVQWRFQEFPNGEGVTTNYNHIKRFFISLFKSYNDMELTFVDAVNDI